MSNIKSVDNGNNKGKVKWKRAVSLSGTFLEHDPKNQEMLKYPPENITPTSFEASLGALENGDYIEVPLVDNVVDLDKARKEKAAKANRQKAETIAKVKNPEQIDRDAR